ncbi:uncharacterized protein [Amphiura filiformis]|uniref:uncharacterized protein n=1 Tax=Amphiura filiformis TaxID=82378 RepID=UPI003B216C9A
MESGITVNKNDPDKSSVTQSVKTSGSLNTPQCSSPNTNDSTPLRVLLWAPPRSLSTAFERCIASSGDDVQVYHEMYTAAYHLGPDRQVDIPVPVAAPVVSESQFTYDWVQQELERVHTDGTRVIFCKELSYSVQGHFDYLPSGYKHTFLIRHPAKVFLSMSNLLQTFVAKHVMNLTIAYLLPHGLVFKELYELFCYITNTLGQTPIIIDADDLIEHPEKTLRAYCQAIGLPYTPSMMQWNTFEDERDRWNYSKRLMFINKVIGRYDRAFSTSTLEKGTEKPIDLTEVTPEILHATESNVQYYEKLRERRIRPLGYERSDGDHIDDHSISNVHSGSDHNGDNSLSDLKAESTTGQDELGSNAQEKPGPKKPTKKRRRRKTIIKEKDPGWVNPNGWSF